MYVYMCIYAYVYVSLLPVDVVGGWGGRGGNRPYHMEWGGREHETRDHVYIYTHRSIFYIDLI